MAKLALAFRAANGADGITGTPPIASIDYRPGGNVGSTVLLDPDTDPGVLRGDPGRLAARRVRLGGHARRLSGRRRTAVRRSSPPAHGVRGPRA